MPPLIGGLQLPHLDELALALVTAATQVYTRAACRNIVEGAMEFQSIDGDRKEVPPEIEDGRDTEEALTQGDEGGDVLNPVGIQMLQLDLVVVQQPAEEVVSGHPEAPLVELEEGDNIAWRGRR